MAAKYNYLITGPYSTKGGVASFVNNVILNFESIQIFYRGSFFSKGYLRVFNVLSLLLMPFRFVFSLIKIKPSYILVNTSLSVGGLLRDGLLVYISKMFRFKVVLIVHGFDEQALKYKYLLRIGYFKADAIMVLACDFSQKLVNAGYDKSIHTFYNPVSTQLLNMFSNSDSVNIKEDFVGFLFIARIERTKGIYICIDAFEAARIVYPNIRLTIAGNGGDYETVRAYVNKKNISGITFKGFVVGEEKSKIFMDSEVLIFPTYYKEGLPINVLEAMTAGMVIITRPVAGLVDLHKQAEMGIVIESLDANDFAAAIIKVIENKEYYKKVRIQNNSFAVQNFNPEKVANNIKQIAESLA